MKNVKKILTITLAIIAIFVIVRSLFKNKEKENKFNI